MTTREIRYTVNGYGITPKTLQPGGIQGEHNVTVLYFDTSGLDLSLEDGYSLKTRLDVTDGAGAFFVSEHLQITDNMILFPIPIDITGAGGTAKFNLVFSAINQDATEEKILYSYPAYLYFLPSSYGTPEYEEAKRQISGIVAELEKAVSPLIQRVQKIDPIDWRIDDRDGFNIFIVDTVIYTFADKPAQASGSGFLGSEYSDGEYFLQVPNTDWDPAIGIMPPPVTLSAQINPDGYTSVARIRIQDHRFLLESFYPVAFDIPSQIRSADTVKESTETSLSQKTAVSETGFHGLRFWNGRFQADYNGQWVDVFPNISGGGAIFAVAKGAPIPSVTEDTWFVVYDGDPLVRTFEATDYTNLVFSSNSPGIGDLWAKIEVGELTVGSDPDSNNKFFAEINGG